MFFLQCLINVFKVCFYIWPKGIKVFSQVHTSLHLLASVFVSLLKQQETSECAHLLKDVRLFLVISKCKLNFNLSSSI